MAQENAWGYKRIHGELKKLGVELSKSCIADVLRRNGLPPAPERGGLTWREFLSRHAHVLLCADLFTKEIWTFCGLRRAYAFFVMHLRTRTILLAEVTLSPHSGWLEQQVRNVLWECDERGIQPRFVLHDRDKCFSGGFDAVLTHAGVEPVKTPCHAPNANAFAERWIRSAREECLRHLVLFGLKGLRRVVRTFQRCHNEHPPHQGIGNRVPCRGRTGQTEHAGSVGAVGKAECEEFLGGLLKSYHRAAA